MFAGLRWVATLPEPAEPSPIFTDQVVVVGVTGRPQLTEVDREVIGSRSDEVQAGAVSIRTRYVGECAAAGWATLGAGRRTTVDEAVFAGGAGRGGRRLGPVRRGRRGAAGATPGSAPWPPRSNGCVAAVGPGAALAAARPDGTLAAYATVDEFVGRGWPPPVRSPWWTPGDRIATR